MRIQYKPYTKTLWWLAQLQSSGKIFLDKSFQSRARWGNKQKQKFLTSCIEGFNLSAVTIAHISYLLADVKMNEGEDCDDAIWLQNHIEHCADFTNMTQTYICIFA